MNPEISQSSDPIQQGPVVSVLQEESTKPPFPDMGSNPADNKPKKGILLILGVVIVVLLTVAVYLLFFADKSVATIGNNGKTIHIPNTASSVQAQFMSDIFAGNMKGAYGLTSTKFKATTNESNFASDEKFLAINQLTTNGVKQKVIKSGTVISGSVVAHSFHVFNYSSVLIKQGGIWRVNNIVIQS